jgi:hypothetical protein
MVSRHKRFYRARRRGAAVFIVVLVLAMLTAIGIFAASAASLSTTSAGHARVATQAHYLGELGVHATLAYLEELGGYRVIDAAQQGSQAGEEPECSGTASLLATFPGAQFDFLQKSECWAYTRYDLEQRIGIPLVDPQNSPDPGGLGHADLDWNFRVEFSDKQVVPVAGGSLVQTQTSNVQFCRVALNARTVIWPSTTGSEDEVIAAAGSQASVSGNVEILCPTGN